MSKWTVLAIVAVGVFMATLDTSVVNISLPAIAAHFHRPLGAAVEWIVIAYLVVIASLMLTIGRLSDIIGRKWIWAGGLAVFTLGSILCGAAPTLALLVFFRALQGIGGAMLMAISPAMLTAAFPREQRGRAIGMNAIFVALGVSAGPTLGGLITQHLSWRWIFYVNVPFGIGGIVATLKLLRDDRTGHRDRFDPVGAVLLGGALAALTLALSIGGDVGWSSPIVVVGVAAAIAGLVALVLVERRSDHPTLDLSLFSNRVFSSATASLVLSFVAMFAVGFVLPFYFEQLRHFTPAVAGSLLTPFPLALAVVAPASGILADRIGTRWLAFAGLVTCTISLVAIAMLDEGSSKLAIVWRLALGGVGQGLFQTPNNSALMGAAPPLRQGVASGILATGRVVGQCISVALAGAVFGTLGGGRAGIRAALLVCACIAAIGALVSLVRGVERRDQTPISGPHVGASPKPST